MLKAEQIKTVLKMIRYHVSSYFLRQLTFSKATIRKDMLFLLEVTLFVLQMSLVMSSVTRNGNFALYAICKSHVTCTWLLYGYQQTL